jgi:pyruvate ferredoxin oxidoreductase gamma subunit
MDDKEIRCASPSWQPDALIIQDPTLLHQVDVFSGLKKDGYILINTTRTFDQLGWANSSRGSSQSTC